MPYFWDRFFKPVLAFFFVFALAGLVSYPFKLMTDSDTNRGLGTDAVRASVGKGMLFALLGGYRSLVSDFVWIKSYVDWEKRDAAACAASINLAVLIDPYMPLYWTQGSSIIAFDFPHWQLESLPPAKRTDTAFDIFKRRNAKIAEEFIDRGLKIFPTRFDLLKQKGQIAIGAGDFKLAEECFSNLVKHYPDSVYARRIYASLLARNGKMPLALDTLEQTIPLVDKDAPVYKLLLEQISKAKNIIEKSALTPKDGK